MTVIATIAMKCPNSKSQFDPKWFELELLLYLINLQWDDCYSENCYEMSKIEVTIWSKMVWVRASVISYNLLWDDCYSNICDEMSKFEVSILFQMVWIRASVISYKSSMRWLLLRQLRWNFQIWSILSNVDWICVIYFIE